MTLRPRLVALHGFLGSVADWETLRAPLRDFDLVACDLWKVVEGLSEPSWHSVGEALTDWLRAVRSEANDVPHLLVGYSFGARLALAAARGWTPGRAPVDAVCFVSCHPGLPDDDREARRTRLASDESWARMFEESPTDAIWTAWDSQPVLAGPGTVVRSQLSAARATLATAMRAFSLGGQPDSQDFLRGWHVPWLWVWGEQDAKFARLAAALRGAGAPGTFAACPQAGHRVPWDNPERFAALLRTWIDSLMPPRAVRGA